ncbi:winged helix-turn-helix transcriptional regulator [Candidatus Saccharibacteria bacterium]|jgi:ArsR family transcriptional regulator|nr:winged helix-turn-helix transcriptional regulator [Candidatus Saccharibacteria bacterium]
MDHVDRSQSVLILKALADEVRLGIVKDIASQADVVPSCDIVRSCARRLELSQPAMSHHFKRLVDAKILLVEKRGTENFYRFNRPLFKVYGIEISKL